MYLTHLNTPGRLNLDGYVATATALTAQLLLANICAIGTYLDLIQYGGKHRLSTRRTDEVQLFSFVCKMRKIKPSIIYGSRIHIVAGVRIYILLNV